LNQVGGMRKILAHLLHAMQVILLVYHYLELVLKLTVTALNGSINMPYLISINNQDGSVITFLGLKQESKLY